MGTRSKITTFTGELPSLELLTTCFDRLRVTGGLHLGGLLYQPPPVAEVKKLQASIEKDGYHKLLEEEDPRLLIAVALNTLRQAPQPVIPFDLYDYVLEVSNQPESSCIYANGNGSSSYSEKSNESKDEMDDGSAEGKIVKLSKLKMLVMKLPIQNWTILLYILGFITDVIDLSTVNEASLDTIVRIFSPTLCRPRGSAFMSLRHLHDLKSIQTVVHSLVVKRNVLKYVTRDSVIMGGGEESASFTGSSMGDRTPSPLHNPLPLLDNASCDSFGDTSSPFELSERTSEGHFLLGKKAFVTTYSTEDMATANKIIDESVGMVFDDISVFKSFSDDLEAIKSSSSDRLPEVQRVSQFVFFPLLWTAMMRVMWNSRALNKGSGLGRSKAVQDEDDSRKNTAELGVDSSPARSSFMLSGTFDGPRDRKRMIAACRTLRSQITQYEDIFLHDSGHLPRGYERYPFASTYAQYKQWKREIRNDASTRVQALVRGFIARRKNPLVRVKSQQRNDTEVKDNGLSCYVTELKNLLVKKKQVKNQLKEYDEKFLQNTGQIPTKLDKEPMRDTYRFYSSLKRRISELKLLIRNGRHKNTDLEEVGMDPSTDECKVKAQNEEESNIELHEKLKKDKKTLQALLEQFEKTFKEANGRPVSSRADIAPVEAEYTRYRELKRKLACRPM